MNQIIENIDSFGFSEVSLNNPIRIERHETIRILSNSLQILEKTKSSKYLSTGKIGGIGIQSKPLLNQFTECFSKIMINILMPYEK